MAKATLKPATTDSPSEEVVRSATEIKYATDARGRRIGVVRPKALLRFRLLKILGAENAKNEPLLGNAMLAFLVREIHGETIPPVNSERQLEAMIDRLDDDGLAAVAECLQKEYGLGDPGDTEEQIKN